MFGDGGFERGKGAQPLSPFAKSKTSVSLPDFFPSFFLLVLQNSPARCSTHVASIPPLFILFFLFFLFPCFLPLFSCFFFYSSQLFCFALITSRTLRSTSADLFVAIFPLPLIFCSFFFFHLCSTPCLPDTHTDLTLHTHVCFITALTLPHLPPRFSQKEEERRNNIAEVLTSTFGNTGASN